MIRALETLIVRARRLAAALALLLIGAPAIHAAVPPMLNYQGYLTDASGIARAGAVTMSIAIYADSTGGAPSWTESYEAVNVTRGVFNVLLGSVTPIPETFFGSDGDRVWIELTVNDTTLAPRRPIVSVPHAFHAAISDSATRVPPGNADTLWTAASGDIHRLGGNVGIGTASPGHRLDVAGTVQATTLKIPTGAVAGHVLTSDPSGTASWQPTAATGLGGSGSANALAKFTGPTALASSEISESAGAIGVGIASPSGKLHVQGNAAGDPTVVVQGAVSQTADLQQWKDGSGTVLATMGPSGALTGSGAGLTDLSANELDTGTVPGGRLSGTYPIAVTFNHSSNSFSGTFSGTHSGTGTGLMSLNAGNLSTGTLPSARLSGTYSNPLTLSNTLNSFSGTGTALSINATSLITGTVPSARLSGTYGNALFMTNASNVFAGSGTGLTALSASNLTGGNLSPLRMPTSGNWAPTSVISIGSPTFAVDPVADAVGVGTTTPQSKLDVQGGHVRIGSYGAVEGMHYQTNGGTNVVRRNILIQCGEKTAAGGGGAGTHYTIGVITFPVAFTEVLSVQLTSDQGWYIPQYNSLTSTGFTIVAACVVNTAPTNVTVKWCACGVKD